MATTVTEVRPTSDSSTTKVLLDKAAADLEKLPDPGKESPRRWLSCAMVAMLGLLAFATGGGLIVSGLVLGNKLAMEGQCAGQSFVLFASLLALPFLGLYLQAARVNFPVIRSQACQHPLHSWTIIVARLDFLAWAIALVPAAVAVARPPDRGTTTHLRVDLAFCVLGLLSMTVCLVVVEKASEPFLLPWWSSSPSFVCRVSEFESQVLYDDSVSRRASRQMSRLGRASRRASRKIPPTPPGPHPLEQQQQQQQSPAVAETPPALPSDDGAGDDDAIVMSSLPETRREQQPPPPDTTAATAAAAVPSGLRMPEPTYQPRTAQYLPFILPPQGSVSRGWWDEWSAFAGEAGLRRSGGSTAAGGATTAASSDFTVTGPSSSSSSDPAAPAAPVSSASSANPPVPGSAPYCVWAPVKAQRPSSQSYPGAHGRSSNSNSSSNSLSGLSPISTVGGLSSCGSGRSIKKPVLPTLREIMTPLSDTDIDGYLGPWSPTSAVSSIEEEEPRGSVGLGIREADLKRRSPSGTRPLITVRLKPSSRVGKGRTAGVRHLTVEVKKVEAEGDEDGEEVLVVGEKYVEKAAESEAETENGDGMRIPGSFVH